MQSTRCSERRRDGEPCRGRPVIGDGNGRCPAHGGRRRQYPADPEEMAAQLLAEAAAASERAASAFLTAACAWE